jgi:hypothetical protein
MRRHRVALAAALLFAGSLPLAAAALPAPNDELLHSARLWEARDRGDLAVLALEKLALARPDDADILRRLGELQLRIGDAAGAGKTLERLQRLHGQSPAAATLAEAYRFGTRDRLRMASLKRLIETGRDEEALQALRTLFPQGAPDGDLGLEYNRFLAQTPGGWEPARRGYERLIAAHPDEPRYEMALAQLLAGRDATRNEGLRRLAELSQREDLRSQDIGNALKSGVDAAGLARAPQPALEALLKFHPEDEALKAQLAARQRAVETRRLREERVLASIEPGFQAQQRELLRQRLEQAVAQPQPPPPARQALAVLKLSENRVSEAWELLRDTPPRPPRIERAVLFGRWSAESRAARQRGELKLAERSQRAALALEKNNIEAAVAQADAMAAEGASPAAGLLLQDLARLAPADEDLLRSRTRWLAANGQADQALALVDADRVRGREALRAKLRAEVLSRRAESALLAGRRGEALRDLETAHALQPDDPWLRYSLARLYAQLGLPRQGRELMAEGLQRQPREPDMRYAQALYLSSIEARSEALAALQGVPPSQRSAGMQRLEARLRIGQARANAQRALAKGDREGAARELAAVEPLAGNDPGLLGEIASGWLALGDRERALAPLRLRAAPEQEPSTPTLLGWADLLDQAREDAELRQVMQRLRQTGPLAPEQQREFAALERRLDLREVRELQASGRYAAAQRRIAELLAQDPQDARLLETQADLDAARGDWAQARARYAALLLRQPEDLELRLSHARALAETGDRAGANAELEKVLAAAPADALSPRLGVVRRRVALGQYEQAGRELEALQAQFPGEGEVQLQLARLREAQGRYAEAAGIYRAAGLSPGRGTAEAAARGLAGIEARRQGWITGSIDFQDKPGDDGVSSYAAIEAPLELRIPYRYDGHFIAHADGVFVDTGRLKPDYDTAALFGQFQAAGPASLAVLGNGRGTSQEGVALAVGYETPRWHADIGTTPLGFEVEDVVGEAEWTPEIGGLDAGIGFSRRPVTSSLLSYAGERDPVSGETWGGVRKNALSGRLAYYGPHYSLSGSLELARLEGRNVLDNDYYGGRVSGDVKLLDGERDRVYLGASANYSAYSENQRFYTFGHGGYYSPQSYLTLSLPLEWQGRRDRWSFELRASVSQSFSKEDPAPFYPTDPALQAQAAGSPLPSGYSAPVYGGGSGSGSGYSLRGVVEYRLFDWLVVGGRAGVDRSDYYEPNFFNLYFRHLFGGGKTEPHWPPKPPKPYSEF